MTPLLGQGRDDLPSRDFRRQALLARWGRLKPLTQEGIHEGYWSLSLPDDGGGADAGSC